jgi:proline iminopeptidase
VLVLHGGPGLDHTEFGHHLDPLGDELRLLLVDLREQGASDRGTPPGDLDRRAVRP